MTLHGDDSKGIAAPSGAEALDLPGLNSTLEASSAEKIVSWAATQFGNGLVMSSSFGAESALLIHMAVTHLPRIKIVMVDTGYLFPETWDFMSALRQRFDLNIWVYRTRKDPIVYLAQAGEDDSTQRKDIDSCCGVNKNEPFERAMKELKPTAWIRGIRRQQASTRKSRSILEWSGRYGCYAISPLLNMTSKDIYYYMKQHDLPYHPLYEQGYTSIGCNPLSCTRPIQPGEDARAGRWAGTGKIECGLNVDSIGKDGK